uniref:Non-specific serine/threonine protein kinase n=1 Tax=Panagrolaimus sp. PS1159 TaxID=55785 RepID=A0AC35GV65_9BILA
MGKFDVSALRYLESEHFRVLMALEMGMKNHEVVPLPLISSIAGLHRGATFRVLGDLLKNRLGSYERGRRYDGYRLTIRGYDYLSLRALRAREVVGSVGNQIGVGKESDIYIAGDPEKNDVVLKFHRLGRTSFRKIKEKRDYHKKRHYCSWLYLSRIAALKEFSFLEALHKKNFSVPKPIDACRHVVVMGLIDGLTLCHVDSLPNVGEMYDKLMALIVRLARYGVIHSDFNEFNIIITHDGEPIMIDFPQMVSIDHENASFYFNRDVQCVRDFFKRKFDFDCDEYPKFEEIERKHNLDVEVSASGFTKQMQLDLNQAYDKGQFEAHLEEGSSETEDDEDDDDDEEADEDYDKEELEAIQEEGEEQKNTLKQENRFTNWIESAQNRLNELATAEKVDDEECPQLIAMDEEQQKKYEAAIKETEQKLQELGVSDGEEDDNGLEDHEDVTSANGEKYRKKKDEPRGKVTQARSIYSTGSTIAPGEIKKRLLNEKNKSKKEKLKVKGKQCAVQRGRRQNRDLLKEYEGWDF